MYSINLDPLVAFLKEVCGTWHIGAQSVCSWIPPHLSPLYLGPGSLVFGLIYPLRFPHILGDILLPLVSRRMVSATKG